MICYFDTVLPKSIHNLEKKHNQSLHVDSALLSHSGCLLGHMFGTTTREQGALHPWSGALTKIALNVHQPVVDPTPLA